MKNIFTVDIEELHHRFAYSKECEKSGIKFDGTALEGVIRFIRLLNKYGHTATFFVVGEILAKYPIIGKLIVNNGHEIANHTYSHTEFKDFKSISDFEKSIDKTDKLISKICKVKNIGFRAPKWNLPTDMNKIVNIVTGN